MAKNILDVSRTEDFEVNGRGDHPAWQRAKPSPMACREPLGRGDNYATWFKALWSTRGVYFFIDCTDPLLTTTGLPDFGHLYREDVAEVFLWPDQRVPIYFEYNISPMGSELPIMVPHFGDHYYPWAAWRYEGRRKVRKAVSVRGGPQQSFAKVEGWSAELFIPSVLLAPLRNARPKKGVEWRANVFRIDYDTKPAKHFAWHDVGPSFHNYKEYATLRFI